MGKSNAERQAAYRARHLQAVEGGMERLNLTLSVSAKAQLERLAACYAVTQRTTLENLLAQAERTLLDSLSAEDQRHYLDRQPLLRSNGETGLKRATPAA